MQRVADIPVKHQDLGIYVGDIATEIPELKTPVLHFTGSPIPQQLWKEVISFMKWTYDKYKRETQIKLFYNEEGKSWAASPLPQYLCPGLFSEEIKDDPQRDTVLEPLLNLGYSIIGTVHHHCSASAFQSGTDHRDEINTNGLHVTFGSMGSAVFDFHARVTFRKVQYEVNLLEWFGTDLEAALAMPPAKLEFPEVWKDCLKEKPKSTGFHGSYQTRGTGAYTSYVDRSWTNHNSSTGKLAELLVEDYEIIPQSEGEAHAFLEILKQIVSAAKLFELFDENYDPLTVLLLTQAVLEDDISLEYIRGKSLFGLMQQVEEVSEATVFTELCETCDGEGSLHNAPCYMCGGTGFSDDTH